MIPRLEGQRALHRGHEFGRLHVRCRAIEHEAGAAVIDRVNTTMQVWMGVTLGCAQCHDHKYDPFSQREYYRLFAFFNNTEDSDRNDDAPLIRVPSDAQVAETARLRAVLDSETTRLNEQERRLAESQPDWEAAVIASLENFRTMQPELSGWSVAGPLKKGISRLCLITWSGIRSGQETATLLHPPTDPSTTAVPAVTLAQLRGRIAHANRILAALPIRLSVQPVSTILPRM